MTKFIANDSTCYALPQHVFDAITARAAAENFDLTPWTIDEIPDDGEEYFFVIARNGNNWVDFEYDQGEVIASREVFSGKYNSFSETIPSPTIAAAIYSMPKSK